MTEEEEGMFGISFQKYFDTKGFWKRQKLLKGLRSKEVGQFLKAFNEWSSQKLQKQERDRKEAEEINEIKRRKRAELAGVKLREKKEIGENPLVWVWHNKGKALLGLVIFCFIVGIVASMQPPETSICLELNEIRVLLEDRPTTAKKVDTAYRKIQRLNYDCRGWEYDW